MRSFMGDEDALFKGCDTMALATVEVAESRDQQIGSELDRPVRVRSTPRAGLPQAKPGAEQLSRSGGLLFVHPHPLGSL